MNLLYPQSINTHSHFPNSNYSLSTPPTFAAKSSFRPQIVHLLLITSGIRGYLADRFGIFVERPLICLGFLRGCILLVRSSVDLLRITIINKCSWDRDGDRYLEDVEGFELDVAGAVPEEVHH